jgi:hypothetical protein
LRKISMYRESGPIECVPSASRICERNCRHMRQLILRQDKGGRRYADLSLGSRVESVLVALRRRGRQSIPRHSLRHGPGRRYFTQKSKLSGMNANTPPQTTPNRVGRDTRLQDCSRQTRKAAARGLCSRGSPLRAAPRRPQARRDPKPQRNGDLALVRCSVPTIAMAAQAGLAFAIYPFRDGVENTPDPSPSYRRPEPRFLHSRFLCKFNGLRV